MFPVTLFNRIKYLFLVVLTWMASGFSHPSDLPVSGPDARVPEWISVASSFNVYEPKAKGDFNSLIIPLKRAGRILLIEAEIDGVVGNLVFDTGATGLVLNRTYFRKAKVQEAVTSNGITGTATTYGTTIAGRVTISDLYYENCPADVSDLSHLENQKGVKIIGLFGYNMIRPFEMVLDVSNNELQLHRIDQKGNRLEASAYDIVPDHVQKVDPSKPVLVIKARVGEKELNFCFDTGAETNAIHNRLPKSVLNTISITKRSVLRGAGQSTNEVLLGNMNEFRLGDRKISGMETIIANLEALSEAYGTHIDGMLGYSFLEQGTITLNLVKRQFSIRYINS